MAKPPRSKLEASLDEALLELFPQEIVKHDMPIKIGRSTLYVDRVIESKKLAFETDGKQHDQFSAFHHKDRSGFEDSKKRDSLKEQWLLANGYYLVRFKHDERIGAKLVRDRILKVLNAKSN